MAEFDFRSMEGYQNKANVTIQFLVAGLGIQFARIFHLSCSVQKLRTTFIFVQWLQIFFVFGGKYDPRIFC
jgi:hypothetical protein